jgi:hypothetical protein
LVRELGDELEAGRSELRGTPPAALDVSLGAEVDHSPVDDDELRGSPALLNATRSFDPSGFVV